MIERGRAFMAKKLYDLALTQLDTAKSEIGTMTGQKKDVIYELGACHERMSQSEQAIAEFKLIYSEDIEFRDVAEESTLTTPRRGKAFQLVRSRNGLWAMELMARFADKPSQRAMWSSAFMNTGRFAIA